MFNSRPRCPGLGLLSSLLIVSSFLLIGNPIFGLPAPTPTPVWSDEFDGTGAPDASKWNFDVGNLHVNNEVEIYCPNPLPNPLPSELSACDGDQPNAFREGGNLVIRARRTGNTWTSARLKGQYINSSLFQYGRIEARMKLPYPHPGIWPAFWALGVQQNGEFYWPDTGEIDFMENVPANVPGGLGANKVSATIHGPGYYGGGKPSGNGISNTYTFPSGQQVDTDFHIYGAIWSPYMVQFYVDDPSNIFHTASAADIPAGTQWVFNRKFFLILNLAIGGTGSWPGPTDGSTPSPSDMLVDWVRVYNVEPVPQATITVTPFSETLHWGVASSTQAEVTGGSGKMYLRCEDVPAGSTCTISPAVIDFDQSASPTVTVTFTPQPGNSFVAMQGGLSGRVKLTMAGGAFLGLLSFALLRRRAHRVLAGISLLAVILLLGTLIACGGGGGSNPPPRPSPTPTATPTPSPSPTPTPATLSFKVAGYPVDATTLEATVTADVE